MKNWEYLQFRYLFKILSGSTPETGNQTYWEGKIYWITPEDVTQANSSGYIFETKRKITELGFQNSGTTIAPVNSIVLTKRAPIGQLAILRMEACSNQGCFLLAPKSEVEPRFYFYFLMANKEKLQVLGRGSTFMELSIDDLKSLSSPFLFFETQRRIATYLDRETAQIDALIAAKERLLALLAEKRQALITRAVTRGLDPAVKMKDSGVEWLGKVPEGWEVKQLRFVCNEIKTGGTPNADFIDDNSLSPINWFTPGDFSENIELKESKRKLNSETPNFEGFHLFPKNTVLVVGIGATLGKIGIIEEASFSNQQINALIFKKENFSKYFAYQLSILSEVLMIMSNSSTLPILNQQKLGDIYVVAPSLEEQVEVTKYIKIETSKIDTLRSTTERSITLLKERRSALISAAVTGQVTIPE